MKRQRHLQVYRAILRLYPASFRSELGAEMEEVFASRLETAASAGKPARAVWLREIASLPFDLLDAWAITEEGDAPPGRLLRGTDLLLRLPRLALLLAIGLALAASAAVSEMIGRTGLFHPLPVVLLVAGLVAAAVTAGVAPRIAERTFRARVALLSVIVLAAALLLPLGVDRLLLHAGRDPVRLALPGVALSAARFQSPHDAAGEIARARSANAASVRIVTRPHRDATLVMITTAGDVDHLYAGAAFVLLATCAMTARLAARNRLRVAD